MIRLLRSVAINIAFYLSTAFWVLFMLPSLFLKPPGYIIWGVSRWGRTNLMLFRWFGLDYEFRGLDNIPKDGQFIIGAKHQSAWETFALTTIFDQPAYVYKRELIFVPLFGWLMARADQIPINRTKGRDAMPAIIAGAKRAIALGRHFMIYVEGTRKAVDAPPSYKRGIVEVYMKTGVPCVPVALNSGLFWPRRTFMREKGTVLVEILPPIPAGLAANEFMARLQHDIESATARLVAESRAKMEM